MRLCSLIFVLLFLFACSQEDSMESDIPPYVESSPYVVDIDWEEAELSVYNDEDGIMTISFGKDVPELEEGLSLIVVGTEHVTAVRRVMKIVDTNGTSVTLETQQASMADLFPNQNISLVFQAPERINGVSSTRASNGDYLPVEIEILTKDGYSTIYDATNVTRADDGSYENLTFSNAFFHSVVDTCGMPLFDMEWSPIIDRLLFDIGLYGRFNFDFASMDKEIIPGLKVEVGDLLTFDYVFSGTALLDVLLRAEYEQSFADDLSRTLMKTLVPTLRFRFMVGGVPVHIVVDSSLEAEGQISLSGKVATTTGFRCSSQIGAGVSWSKGNGFKFQQQSTPNNTFQLYSPTIEMDGKFDLKGSVYPHIDIKFYDFIGVSFDLKPYLANTIKAGALMEWSGSGNYASLTDSLFAGMDFASEVSLEFAGNQFAKSQVPNGGINLFNTLLFAAPAAIEARDDALDLVGGESVKVDFDVYDFNITAAGNYTPSGFGLVRFSSDKGELSHRYAMPMNGSASVMWIPAKGDDCLFADLLGADGEVIASDTLIHTEALGLIGYWEMIGYYYMEYDSNGNILDEDDVDDEFWNLRFMEDGIYHDVDPDGSWSVGRYEYNGTQVVLDSDEEYSSVLAIIKLDNENLVLEYRDSTPIENNRWYLERFSFKRRIEEE